MILKSLLFLTLFVKKAWSQSIDMINEVRVDHPWIEIGFVDVDTSSWVRVDALGTQYDNAVILTALPDLGGELYTQGFSTATRIRNVVNSGNVHFEVKLFQPNDSFCSKQWYVPKPIGPIEIGYTIVEYGSFFVANKHQFIIGTGLANRTRATLTSKSPDFHPLAYPFGCSAARCVFPQSINLYELGAIATIQSLVYDTYLLLRISNIVRRQLTVVLTPHDSLDLSYFYFPEPETVGFMVFGTGITLSCIERVAIETKRWTNVSSIKLHYPFFWQYVKSPAVFGMIISQTSFVDSVALRVFSRTSTDAYIITQEDVCDGADPIHITPEFASALVAGEHLGGTEICDAIYRAPTNAPTSAPAPTSLSDPTFVPSNSPSVLPTRIPTYLPTRAPIQSPTRVPTIEPTRLPSVLRKRFPTTLPTRSPTRIPSAIPSRSPTRSPTRIPTIGPSRSPTRVPTRFPNSNTLPSPRPTRIFQTSTPTNKRGKLF